MTVRKESVAFLYILCKNILRILYQTRLKMATLKLMLRQFEQKYITLELDKLLLTKAKSERLNSLLKLGGERGIRTLETFRFTRFPSVRHRPLGDLSKEF